MAELGLSKLLATRLSVCEEVTQRKSLHDFGGYNHLLTSFAIQIELGTACGKLFRCSTMAVLDAGDSDILSGQTS